MFQGLSNVIIFFAFTYFFSSHAFAQNSWIDSIDTIPLNQALNKKWHKTLNKAKTLESGQKIISICANNVTLNLNQEIIVGWQIEATMSEALRYYYRKIADLGNCDYGYIISQQDSAKSALFYKFYVEWADSSTHLFYILKAESENGLDARIVFESQSLEESVFQSEYPESIAPTIVQPISIWGTTQQAYVPYYFGIAPLHLLYDAHHFPEIKGIADTVKTNKRFSKFEFTDNRGWRYELAFANAPVPWRVQITNISAKDAYALVDDFIEFNGCFPDNFERVLHKKAYPQWQIKEGDLYAFTLFYYQAFPMYRVSLNYDADKKQLSYKATTTRGEGLHYKKHKKELGLYSFSDKSTYQIQVVTPEVWKEIVQR